MTQNSNIIIVTTNKHLQVFCYHKRMRCVCSYNHESHIHNNILHMATTSYCLTGEPSCNIWWYIIIWKDSNPLRVCNVRHNHTVQCCLSCMYDHNNMRCGKSAAGAAEVAGSRMCFGCTGCWSSLRSKLFLPEIHITTVAKIICAHTIIKLIIYTCTHTCTTHMHTYMHTNTLTNIIHIYICTHEVNMILL